MIDFCKKLDFKEVIELEPLKEIKLATNFTVINGLVDHDSWLCIKTDQRSFMNTNDCMIQSKEHTDKIVAVTGEIDLLLTQFSYASKSGNTDQPEKRKKEVDDKYKQMQIQIDAFKPSYFIPMASYIWYSHEENFYMNDEINRLDRVVDFLKGVNVIPLIMYPGDTYNIGAAWDNTESIRRYEEDLDKISIANTTKTVSIPMETITDSAKKLIQQLKKEDKVAFAAIAFYPVKFYLTDLQKAVKFSVISGLKEIQVPKEKTNIQLTSEVLNYCLKFNWGFGTTNVNARFQTTTDKDLTLFNYYVSVTDSLNHNDSAFGRIMNKIKREITAVF